jgi:hypothetical protein
VGGGGDAGGGGCQGPGARGDPPATKTRRGGTSSALHLPELKSSERKAFFIYSASTKTKPTMAGASAKRLAKELTEMEKNPLPWAKAQPVGDSLYKWRASITGPVTTPSLSFCLPFQQERTPYENGTFNLELEMPPEYPFKAPKVAPPNS